VLTASYFAHGSIVCFVLIQFLLHGTSEFEQFFILSVKQKALLRRAIDPVDFLPSISNVGIFTDRGTQSGDLLGNCIEMCRSLRDRRWVVGNIEGVRRVKVEYLSKVGKRHFVAGMTFSFYQSFVW
jgi:hypothetical protein